MLVPLASRETRKVLQELCHPMERAPLVLSTNHSYATYFCLIEKSCNTVADKIATRTPISELGGSNLVFMLVFL